MPTVIHECIIFVGGKTFEKEDGGTVLLTLGDLLAFVTGADRPPPLGFLYSPEIEFSDDADRTLPWASTCTMVLHLSLHVHEYDLLCCRMDEAIISTNSFGIL